jgi:hypothetical protein
VTLWRWIKVAVDWSVAGVKWWVITFVIGDDWRVAARIAVALLATWGLVEAGVQAWWLLPPAVLYATVRSLHRAVVRER